VRSLDLIFMGTPDIAVPALRALAESGHNLLAVITQPDRPAGRGRKLKRCPVAQEAIELGLKVLQPERVGTAARDLIHLKADAACVMAFGQLLPAELLEAFPMGCINVHTSLLPELRGAAPINWAIVQGKKRTGVTTMLMDEGLDSGDMFLQQATEIGPQETAGSLADRLAKMGAELLVRTLNELQENKLNPRPQEESGASYARRLTKSDGLVDWQQPATEVDLLVRGLDPWPTAYTLLEGKAFRLFGPTGVLDISPPAQPGALIEPPPGREDLLWIACGRGAIGVGQVQAAGKRRMATKDFLRGAHLGPGTLLGG
jgi:methionyl-tRNA formyltransferase